LSIYSENGVKGAGKQHRFQQILRICFDLLTEREQLMPDRHIPASLQTARRRTHGSAADRAMGDRAQHRRAPGMEILRKDHARASLCAPVMQAGDQVTAPQLQDVTARPMKSNRCD